MNQAGGLFDAVSAGWTAYDRSLGRDFLKHRVHGAGRVPAAGSLPAAPETRFSCGPGSGA
jgi:hypothetical protein